MCGGQISGFFRLAPRLGERDKPQLPVADRSSPADREDEAEEASDERSPDADDEARGDAPDGDSAKNEAIASGAGRRRLSFASRYPESAELDALLDAFEAGNFERVRTEGPALAQRAEDPEISRAARDLVSRLSPDPLAVRMLLGAGLLLLFLIYWFYSDHH